MQTLSTASSSPSCRKSFTINALPTRLAPRESQSSDISTLCGQRFNDRPSLDAYLHNCGTIQAMDPAGWDFRRGQASWYGISIPRLMVFRVLSLPPELNATTTSGQPYVIPQTDLILVVTLSKSPLGIKDTLLLLMESLFSATKRINAGGRSAVDPVELLTHKHGYSQIQVIGYYDKLTPFKLAQVFMGMATVGAQAGYYDSSIIVVEHHVGPIAQVHIR